jgi:LysM repeat protein
MPNFRRIESPPGSSVEVVNLAGCPVRNSFKEGVRRLTKSLPSVVRLEPITRYLFRRVVVVPALAGLAIGVALPLVMPVAEAQTIKSDSGSMGPIVSITKPEYSDVLKGDVQIVIAVQPRRYPAESVELLVDGRSVSGVLPIQNLFKWKTELFPDGQHSLTVRVTDTQGFIGQSQTNVFINNSKTVTDTTAPVLNWVGLQNGQSLSGQIKVQLEARDDFGVKYVFLRLNPAITPDVKPALASWMTNQPPYEFSLDTSKYADGLYVLDAYTWDDKENEESAPRLTVGFYNHGLNPTGFQPTAPVVTTQENATQDKVVMNDDKTPAPPKVDENAGQSTTGGSTPVGRSAQNVAPPAPPIITFQSLPFQGALHSTPATNSGADFTAERQPAGQASTSPPVVLRESSSLVKPPSKVSTPAEPVKTVEPAQGAKTQAVKTVETVEPNKPTIVATRPDERPSLPPAFSIQPAPAPESLLSPLATTSDLEVLPGLRSAPSATLPSGLPRVAALFSNATSSEHSNAQTNLEIGAATVISDNAELNSVIAARMTPQGVRIAAVLPDELPTPPAQTVWRSLKTPSVNPHLSADGAQKFVTTLPTSPNTTVTTAHSLDQDPARDEHFEMLPTTPPLIRSSAMEAPFKPEVAKPAVTQRERTSPEKVAAPIVTENRSGENDSITRIARSDSPELNPQHSSALGSLETRPLVSEPSSVPAPKVVAMLPPSSTNRLPQLLSHISATPLATRISAAPSSFEALSGSRVESTPALPSLPRVAMSPDFRRQAAQPRSSAAIVVSPLQPVETTSYTAMRDESLAQIANRFKMPLSVVAATNGLSPNVQIVRGTQLLIPRSLQVSYKGQSVTSDVAPLLIGHTSVGAFRFLFEKQGGTMSWDAAKQQVTAKNDKYEVTLTVGSNKAVVNQKEEMMDMAAFLLSGRTMVPIRFFESALNAKVEWEPSTGRIYVASTR